MCMCVCVCVCVCTGLSSILGTTFLHKDSKTCDFSVPRREKTIKILNECLSKNVMFRGRFSFSGRNIFLDQYKNNKSQNRSLWQVPTKEI